MLNKMRSTVEKMWSIAEALDKRNLGEHIPLVPENGDIRHTMKLDIIVSMFYINGNDNALTDEQLEYLRFVLHAPINDSNKEEYAEHMKDCAKLKFSSLLPYLVMIDKVADSDIAETYVQFTGALTLAFLQCGPKIDVSKIMRYVRVMQNNVKILKAGYTKPVEFNPLDFIEDDKREMIEKIISLDMSFDEKDELLESCISSLKALDSNDNKNSSADYNEFEKKLKEDSKKEDKKDSAEDDDNENVSTFDENPRSREELLNELDSLIGLHEVKNQVKSMFNLVQIRQLCKERNIKRQGMSYHMVFSGNPGTGKTTVARLVAELYHDMGLLSKGHLVEVSRGDLVAGYVGHTAIQVKNVIKKAIGGVLFIDEAYSLTSHSGSDFGHEAIETLIKGMEDNREDLVVIVAGYPKLMNKFLDSNPGLRSRFTKTIYFPDYTSDELTDIFKRFCNENSIKTSKSVIEIARKYFEGEVLNKNETFGNARMVRNYFEEATINQANRLVTKENITDNMLCRLCEEDMPKRFYITNDFFKAV